MGYGVLRQQEMLNSFERRRHVAGYLFNVGIYLVTAQLLQAMQDPEDSSVFLHSVLSYVAVLW
jgi:hypothetical protein